MIRFRPNVALILRRPSGEILVCERKTYRDSWQFPQGGRKEEEDELDALFREVEEEIRLSPSNYRIITRRGPYRYLFRRGSRKEGYHGQEQTYYLAEYTGDPSCTITVDRQEFRAARWILPDRFRIEWVPPVKRKVYHAVFMDFFGVDLLKAP